MAKEIAKFLLVATLVAAANLGSAQAATPPPVVNVAIITDGSSPRVESLRALFLDEMRTVNRGDFDIQAPPAL